MRAPYVKYGVFGDNTCWPENNNIDIINKQIEALKYQPRVEMSWPKRSEANVIVARYQAAWRVSVF